MIHDSNHPLANKKVILNESAKDPARSLVVAGAQFWIENWVDQMDDRHLSWKDMNGNFAAMHYGFRAGATGLPRDDEVVYGKIGAFDHMVHASELGEVTG